MTNRRKISLLLFLLLSITASAQSGDTLTLNVYFKQGRSDISMDYRDNGETLTQFIKEVNAIQRNSSEGLSHISIETAASPEGSYELNERLAMERARSIRTFLTDNLPLNASQIRTYSAGINWEGLVNIILTTDSPWKGQMMQVVNRYGIKTTADRLSSDSCRKDLMAIDGGKAWQWLTATPQYQQLRHATGKVSCVMNSSYSLARVRDTLVIIHEYEKVENGVTTINMDSVYAAANKMVEEKLSANKRTKGFKKDSLFREPVVALRSNLLVPLSNIGIEVPLTNRWSIEADWYSPWMYRSWINAMTPYYMNCFQFQAAYVCSRVWLGKRHSDKTGDPRYRLIGHSIGFGVSAFHYDLGRDYEGQQSDGASFGVDYKYALPLGKGNVHLEFTAGVCAYWRTYLNYKVEHETVDGEVVCSGRLTTEENRQQEWSIAPFKAGVSIVVPICKKKEDRQ